ncbi:hypothetical protein LCGC14_0908700 [marine sediment metagenome]|uniref:Uncharacterized protein n=1 Tax=marine sediment metagenome TaxID=412755 RepID=A0A0F9NU95_9ZZZZ
MVWETTNGHPTGDSARAYPDYAEALQSIVDLRAVPTSERADKQVRFVEDVREKFHYDEQAVGSDDGGFNLVPDDVTPPDPGRWIKLSDEKSIEPVLTVDDTLTDLITLPIDDDTVVGIETRIVGIRTDTFDLLDNFLRATVYRTGGGGAVRQGLTDTPYSRNTPSAGVWTTDIVVSGNNAVVQVKGQTGHDVKWRAFVKVLEVA